MLSTDMLMKGVCSISYHLSAAFPSGSPCVFLANAGTTSSPAPDIAQFQQRLRSLATYSIAGNMGNYDGVSGTT